MKYKVGDKVKIKTWEEMEKKYGLNKLGNINSISGYCFSKKDEEEIGKNIPDRVLTITAVNKYSYILINTNWICSDKIIKSSIWTCSEENIKDFAPYYKPKILDLITNRFDILDL